MAYVEEYDGKSGQTIVCSGSETVSEIHQLMARHKPKSITPLNSYNTMCANGAALAKSFARVEKACNSIGAYLESKRMIYAFKRNKQANLWNERLEDEFFAMFSLIHDSENLTMTPGVASGYERADKNAPNEFSYTEYDDELIIDKMHHDLKTHGCVIGRYCKLMDDEAYNLYLDNWLAIKLDTRDWRER